MFFDERPKNELQLIDELTQFNPQINQSLSNDTLNSWANQYKQIRKVKVDCIRSKISTIKDSTQKELQELKTMLELTSQKRNLLVPLDNIITKIDSLIKSQEAFDKDEKASKDEKAITDLEKSLNEIEVEMVAPIRYKNQLQKLRTFISETREQLAKVEKNLDDLTNIFSIYKEDIDFKTAAETVEKVRGVVNNIKNLLEKLEDPKQVSFIDTLIIIERTREEIEKQKPSIKGYDSKESTEYVSMNQTITYSVSMLLKRKLDSLSKKLVEIKTDLKDKKDQFDSEFYNFGAVDDTIGKIEKELTALSQLNDKPDINWNQFKEIQDRISKINLNSFESEISDAIEKGKEEEKKRLAETLKSLSEKLDEIKTELKIKKNQLDPKFYNFSATDDAISKIEKELTALSQLNEKLDIYGNQLKEIQDRISKINLNSFESEISDAIEKGKEEEKKRLAETLKSLSEKLDEIKTELKIKKNQLDPKFYNFSATDDAISKIETELTEISVVLSQLSNEPDVYGNKLKGFQDRISGINLSSIQSMISDAIKNGKYKEDKKRLFEASLSSTEHPITKSHNAPKFTYEMVLEWARKEVPSLYSQLTASEQINRPDIQIIDADKLELSSIQDYYDPSIEESKEQDLKNYLDGEYQKAIREIVFSYPQEDASTPIWTLYIENNLLQHENYNIKLLEQIIDKNVELKILYLALNSELELSDNNMSMLLQLCQKTLDSNDPDFEKLSVSREVSSANIEKLQSQIKKLRLIKQVTEAHEYNLKLIPYIEEKIEQEKAPMIMQWDEDFEVSPMQWHKAFIENAASKLPGAEKEIRLTAKALHKQPSTQPHSPQNQFEYFIDYYCTKYGTEKVPRPNLASNKINDYGNFMTETLFNPENKVDEMIHFSIALANNCPGYEKEFEDFKKQHMTRAHVIGHLENKLENYLENRKNSLTPEKKDAVDALKRALKGQPVDLLPHLSTLRNGELGKTIRAFVKSNGAEPILGKKISTVSDFIKQLHKQVNPLQVYVNGVAFSTIRFTRDQAEKISSICSGLQNLVETTKNSMFRMFDNDAKHAQHLAKSIGNEIEQFLKKEKDSETLITECQNLLKSESVLSKNKNWLSFINDFATDIRTTFGPPKAQTNFKRELQKGRDEDNSAGNSKEFSNF